MVISMISNFNNIYIYKYKIAIVTLNQLFWIKLKNNKQMYGLNKI